MPEDPGRTAPLVDLVCRVGITGHLLIPEAQAEAVDDALESVLKTVRAVVTSLPTPLGCDPSCPPRLRLTSPLATGADQVAARIALDLGYELQVPLPFDAERFEREDLEDETARAAFRDLRDRATAVMEVHPYAVEGAERSAAYLASGQLVVAQSEILVAVWDGKPAAGVGGTGQIVEEALRADVPVVVVPIEDPGSYHLLRGDDGGTDAPHADTAIAETIADLLLPGGAAAYTPRPASDPRSEEHASFLEERGEAHARTDGLEAHEAWADSLAVRHAVRYRRSYVANYLLGALAVTLGLLVLLTESPGLRVPFALGELLCVVLVLSIWGVGRKQRWRRRSISYRTLAEQLRTLRELAPLGLSVPHSRPPAYAGEEEDLRPTWASRHVRAVTRTIPLPATSWDADTRDARRGALVAWVRSQQGWYAAHEQAQKRFRHRMEMASVGFFVLVALAVVADIVAVLLGEANGHDEGIAHGAAIAIALVGIALPAWAAALHAILVQSESHRLAARYGAMAKRLEPRARAIEEAGGGDPQAGVWTLWLPALEAAEDMSGEVANWQALHAPHAIPLP